MGLIDWLNASDYNSNNLLWLPQSCLLLKFGIGGLFLTILILEFNRVFFIHPRVDFMWEKRLLVQKWSHKNNKAENIIAAKEQSLKYARLRHKLVFKLKIKLNLKQVNVKCWIWPSTASLSDVKDYQLSKHWCNTHHFSLCVKIQRLRHIGANDKDAKLQ